MPLRKSDTVIFIYNADSGVFNLLSDMAHKLVSPQTYNCQLCMLTHGHFGMREQWSEFLNELGCELEFLHRDEFNDKYPGHKAELPALFMNRDDETELLLSASAINECDSMEALIKVFNERIIRIPG